MSIGDGLVFISIAIVWAAYVLREGLLGMIPRTISLAGGTTTNVTHRTISEEPQS